MTDIMNIIDRLSDATSSAKRECDIHINKTVDNIASDLKDKIVKHRDFQIKSIEEISKSSEKELEKIKNSLNDNIVDFRNLEDRMQRLLEHHVSIKRNCEAKINCLIAKYRRNRIKQNMINRKELEGLEKHLKKRLIEKMRHFKTTMSKPDETFVKINKMLTQLEDK